MLHDKSKCEYCGAPLPIGVDKKTRRIRSRHFESCPKRPQCRADKEYSILLLYPDGLGGQYGETYYAQVTAKDLPEAIAIAQSNACEANDVEGTVDMDPTDFAPLLALAGHHHELQLSEEFQDSRSFSPRRTT